MQLGLVVGQVYLSNGSLLKRAEIYMIYADARCPSWTFDTLLKLNAFT